MRSAIVSRKYGSRNFAGTSRRVSIVVTLSTAGSSSNGSATRIARDDVEQALTFLERLYEAMTLLATQPEMGRARPELGPHIRSFPVGQYIVFYQPIADGIDVVRVLSGARDIEALF